MMTLDDCRQFYAEEVQFAANVGSPALVAAFARVPRERFLGDGPWRIATSDMTQGGAAYTTTVDADPRRVYHNVPIAIDASRDLNNGQPGTLARWIDTLELHPGERVFHLGCGVGYFTAIIAEVVGSNGRVMASEVDPDLASRARANLASYTNIEVHTGDGAVTDPGMCDAILINAGVTHLPRMWPERLNEGGRIVVPLTVAMGQNLGKGLVVKIVRRGDAYSAQVVTFVAIYSCRSLRDPQTEGVLGKALATGALMKMKALRLDTHEPNATCIVHSSDVCIST